MKRNASSPANSGPVGADQPLARERDEARARSRGARRRGSERRQRPGMKRAALDRGALQQRPLAGLEAVDARGEHRLDARRQLAVVLAGVDGDELLDEQRVALGALRRSARASSRAPRRSASSRACASASASSTSTRAVGLRRGPRRARLEQLGPRQADEQDRRRRSTARRRGRAGPAAPARPSGCPRRRRRAGGRAARRSSSRRSAQAVSSACAGSSDSPIAPRMPRIACSSPASSSSTRAARVAAEAAHDVGQRAVRRALAVGQAAAGEHGRARRRRAARNSPARRDLPIPGGPATVTSRQARSSRARAKRGVQLGELALRGRRTASRARAAAPAARRAARAAGRSSASMRRRRARDRARGSSSPSRISPGAARSASRPAAVIARAGGDRRAARPGAEEHLAGLEPEPQLGGRRAQLDGRPRGAQRVVAVGLGQPEEADERVAEVALDASRRAAR